MIDRPAVTSSTMQNQATGSTLAASRYTPIAVIPAFTTSTVECNRHLPKQRAYLRRMDIREELAGAHGC
jgi:hypothetical protein